MAETVTLPKLHPEMPLLRLTSMANGKTGHAGDNNFIFKYKGDTIDFEDECLKMKDVFGCDEDGEEDDEDESKIVKCYEIDASLLSPRKEIILKNATRQKLKVEVKYHGVDFDKEEDKKYVS